MYWIGQLALKRQPGAIAMGEFLVASETGSNIKWAGRTPDLTFKSYESIRITKYDFVFILILR